MFTVIKQDSELLFKTGEGKRRNEFGEWHGLRIDIIMRNVIYPE